MIRAMLLILMVILMAGCGLFSAAAPAETPVPPEQAQTIVMSPAPEPQRGEFSLEERILNATQIVRATMTSFSSEVVSDAEGMYRAVLKFSVSVSEYLKGSGPHQRCRSGG